MNKQVPKLSRRTVFAGASTAGALAAAVALLPRAEPAAVASAEPLKPAPDAGGGYQETPHVLRYYQTTRV
jgi:hypothetical protein